MGAVNFKSNPFINLCIKPYEADEIAKDADFLQYCGEEYPGEDPETIAAEEIALYYDADAANYNSIAAKYDFYYFSFELIPGYYESIQINIINNLPVFFDDWTEKREALKEVTQIKEFLTECAGVGFQACAPSWCTAYYNHAETVEKIKEAAEAMREEIKSAETWRTHKRKTA